jgi:hypothetical protein
MWVGLLLRLPWSPPWLLLGRLLQLWLPAVLLSTCPQTNTINGASWAAGV